MSQYLSLPSFGSIDNNSQLNSWFPSISDSIPSTNSNYFALPSLSLAEKPRLISQEELSIVYDVYVKELNEECSRFISTQSTYIQQIFQMNYEQVNIYIKDLKEFTLIAYNYLRFDCGWKETILTTQNGMSFVICDDQTKINHQLT